MVFLHLNNLSFLNTSGPSFWLRRCDDTLQPHYEHPIPINFDEFRTFLNRLPEVQLNFAGPNVKMSPRLY